MAKKERRLRGLATLVAIGVSVLAACNGSSTVTTSIPRTSAPIETSTSPRSTVVTTTPTQVPPTSIGDLSEAIRLSDLAAVESLLRSGIDPNEGEYLMQAVQGGDVPIIVALLEGGTDPNRQDDEFRTPLFDATDPEVATILIDFGADPNYESPLGSSPINLAVFGGNIVLLDALIEGGGSPVSALYEAVAILDEELVEYVLNEYNVDPQSPPPPGSGWETELALNSPYELYELVATAPVPRIEGLLQP